MDLAWASAVLLLPFVYGLELKWVVTESKLPQPWYQHAAVYDGQDSIYVIGGYNYEDKVYSNEVIKYSIIDGSVQVVGKFPGKAFGGAVLDGDDIYYFGGLFNGTYSRNITRYTTTTHEYQVVSELTRLLSDFGLAYNPERKTVYVLGGTSGNTHYGWIHEYNISSNTLEHAANIPEPRYAATAVWAESTGLVYVFGGNLGERDIYEYNPVTKISVTLPTKLPDYMEHGCAVYADIDQHVYVLGIRKLIRFNPADDGQVEEVEVEAFPGKIRFAACIYVPKLERMYILGGQDPVGMSDQIAYIDFGEQSTSTTIKPPPIDCGNGSTWFIPNPFCCESFYICIDGVPTKLECPAEQQYNPVDTQCQDADVVQCGLTYGH